MTQTPATIEADDLVIGAGGIGMAFVDTLVAESNGTVAVADRGHECNDPT